MRTPVVVVPHRDIAYEPGWLEALEEHDSDAVVPLIFVGSPTAIVIHHAGDAVDLRHHPLRWADAFVVESLDALEAAWGVTVDRELYRHSWAAAHRVRAAATAYPRRRRLFGERRFARWVAGLEQRILEEQLVLRRDRTPFVPRPVPARDVDRVVGGPLVHSG